MNKNEEEEQYSITENDLKYKKNRNLEFNKIDSFNPKSKNYDEKLLNLYRNINLDTVEFRLNECVKNNYKILDLKHLDLEKIPKIIFKIDKLIENLEELYIGNNLLVELSDLSMFKNLKVVDVSINKLVKISKLPDNIIEFTCFDNKLENIDSIKNCKNIKTLYCSNNKINNLDFLNNSNINIIIANKNNINKMPEVLNSLTKLYIRKNNLENIIIYPNIIYLECSYNKIKNIINKNNNCLIDLLINNNIIEKLSDFKNIKYLEIVNTNIKRLDYYPKLIELICSTDKLEEISNDYKLEKKYLHNNNNLLSLHFIQK